MCLLHSRHVKIIPQEAVLLAVTDHQLSQR